MNKQSLSEKPKEQCVCQKNISVEISGTYGTDDLSQGVPQLTLVKLLEKLKSERYLGGIRGGLLRGVRYGRSPKTGW